MTIAGLLLLLLFLVAFVAALAKWGPPAADARKMGRGHCCSRPPSGK